MSTETLGDALPKEMARVRTILGYYKELGPVGMIGAAVIEQDLRDADQAVMSGDLVRMIHSFTVLRSIKG